MKSLVETIEEITMEPVATPPQAPVTRQDNNGVTSAAYAVTLKQSIADMWTEHLDTRNYVVHMALDNYYQKATEPVDSIIESLKSCVDTTFSLTGVQSLVPYDMWIGNPAGYLSEVRKKMYEARDGMWSGLHDIESDCDDLDKLISEALYKINVLSKQYDSCPSLADYCQLPSQVAIANCQTPCCGAYESLSKSEMKELYKAVSVAIDTMWEKGFKDKSEARKYFQAFVDGKDHNGQLMEQLIQTIVASQEFTEDELYDEAQFIEDILKEQAKLLLSNS